MHQVHETLSPGAVICGRYLVTDLIGTGGFSAVYLVRDQQREDSFFALKEVIATHKEAKELFNFECNLLARLVHPALPRVHRVFEDEEHHRLCMLMDYVEGPDLETLRQIQREKRFSLPVITDFLAPIADAIAYLHQQHPPIIHRDIKPANIIVPIAERKAILVDFGIAKAYDTQGTTSAVRRGSPGYGAPENYSAGTNTRTDIYGLGATLYTLLTGDVPADAIDRMTQLSNDKPDPVKPASGLVTSIPLHVSTAIGRAMSINMMQRFATVQEFWQALQGEPGQQLHIAEALNSIVVSPPTSDVPAKTGETPTRPLQGKQLPARRSRSRFLLPVFLALLLIVGIGAGYWGLSVFVSNPVASPTATFQRPAITPILHPTMTAQGTFNPNLYPHLATSYFGTIDDLQANVPYPMALTHMQQKDGFISGSFSAMRISGPYSGFLDTSKHIYFTVAASRGLGPLYFYGVVQADGNLSGEFCEIDQDGQCLSNGIFGVWSVARGTAPQVKLINQSISASTADKVPMLAQHAERAS
jgi:serine/threonine protein kinase